MTTRLRGPERRQQLLDAALKIFGIGGYAEASMSEIAKAAGITKPVVYQHFESKRALFLEVLDECGHRLENAVEKATANAEGPREQVEQGFSAFVRFFSDNPATFRTMFSDANRSDPEFAARVQRIEMVLAQRIADLIEVEDLTDEDRRMLAHGIVGMAESACRQWMQGTSGLSPERVGKLLADLTWAGLRGTR